ncbi:MAG: 2Fe-2S iron-sulfur cluster-binding protein [Desulfatibacillaceae bacterium]
MSYKVTFKASDRTAEWYDNAGSLLQLAYDKGVNIPSECQQGFCGSCKAKLVSGEVDQETTEGLMPEDEDAGMVLPCVATPKSDVELDC